MRPGWRAGQQRVEFGAERGVVRMAREGAAEHHLGAAESLQSPVARLQEDDLVAASRVQELPPGRAAGMARMPRQPVREDRAIGDADTAQRRDTARLRGVALEPGARAATAIQAILDRG